MTVPPYAVACEWIYTTAEKDIDMMADVVTILVSYSADHFNA
jgi:hypothetical protein